MEPLGAILGVILGHLRGILTASWDQLGPSGGYHQNSGYEVDDVMMPLLLLMGMVPTTMMIAVTMATVTILLLFMFRCMVDASIIQPQAID